MIFCPAAGMPLRGRSVQRGIRKRLKPAGAQLLRSYDLWHTEATLAVAAGVSVKDISDRLGHAGIAFTLERYSYVFLSIQDEAAARVVRMLMG